MAGDSCRKVLVVDDETSIVELLMLVLEGGELEVLAAYDGEQALRAVEEHRPDLVVSDVMMPRLDGRELCRLVKSNPDMSGTGIILMTAGTTPDPEECNADGLIQKPFDVFSVADMISRFPRARRRRGAACPA